MKFGFRTPSVKKSVKARTTGKIKRSVKKSVNPLYGKKGTGYITDPKKAVYNKVYNKTTFGAKDIYDAIDFGTTNNSNSYKSSSSNSTEVSTDSKRKKVQVPIGEHDTKLSERIFETIIYIAMFIIASIIVFWLFQALSNTFQFIVEGLVLITAVCFASDSWARKKTTEYKKVFEDELTEEDKNSINYYKEKAKNELEENKKPFYKNWKVYVSVIILVMSILIGNGADKSNPNKDTTPISGIESIVLQEYSKREINIKADTWLSNEKYLKADITHNSSISFEELNKNIEIVIEDENIATVKSIIFDDNSKYHYTVPITCTLIGVNNGTTTCYFQSTDGKVKSEKVTITVTGISTKEEKTTTDFSKLETTTESTTKETTTAKATESTTKNTTTAATTKKTTTTEKATAAPTTTKHVTTTKKQTTTQNSPKGDGRTVYKTPTGKRYHFDPDCGGKNSSATSLDNAISLGLTPCQKCAN